MKSSSSINTYFPNIILLSISASGCKSSLEGLDKPGATAITIWSIMHSKFSVFRYCMKTYLSALNSSLPLFTSSTKVRARHNSNYSAIIFFVNSIRLRSVRCQFMYSSVFTICVPWPCTYSPPSSKWITLIFVSIRLSNISLNLWKCFKSLYLLFTTAIITQHDYSSMNKAMY